MARDQTTAPTTTLASILRELRSLGGWTRREVAEASGLSLATVRDYEQGKRQPTFESASRLAKAMGVGLFELEKALDLTGVHRLPPGQTRYSHLTFGAHKGQRINEVPTDYLEWLERERPSLLQKGQLKEVGSVLGERRGGKAATEKDGWRGQLAQVAAEQQREEAEQRRQRQRYRPPDEDPIIERAKREQRNRKPPAIPDPEYFGGASGA